MAGEIVKMRSLVMRKELNNEKCTQNAFCYHVPKTDKRRC